LHRLALTLLCFATLLQSAAVQAEAFHVHLVLSDSSEPYQHFATTFKNALVASKADAIVTDSQLVEGHSDLIIAVGMKAAESASTQTSTPVLAAMVPVAAFENMLAKRSAHNSESSISAIFLDQPWGRQFDFLRVALPKKPRVGFLYSAENNIDISRLRQLIAKRGGKLVARQVPLDESIYPSLESVLEDSDVLLAIPDSTIYNTNNIRNILLTSYRHRIPLIGLSQPYVNAGALAAIFSTPELLARQAVSSTILYMQTRKLPGPQYPADFTVAVNMQVARSLGIEIPAPETIHGQMNKAR
jgi:putative ABC transport system substrate-binding protein